MSYRIGPAGPPKRQRLYLSDIMNMDTEEFVDPGYPIYFQNIPIVWPPIRTQVDEITFNLANGEQVERLYGEDIDDDTRVIADMTIARPVREQGPMAAGRKRKRTNRRKSNKKGFNKRRRTNKRRRIRIQ